MSKIEVDVVLMSIEIDRVELGTDRQDGENRGFAYSGPIPGGRLTFHTQDRAYATGMIGRQLVVALKPDDPVPF